MFINTARASPNGVLQDEKRSDATHRALRSTRKSCIPNNTRLVFLRYHHYLIGITTTFSNSSRCFILDSNQVLHFAPLPRFPRSRSLQRPPRHRPSCPNIYEEGAAFLLHTGNNTSIANGMKYGASSNHGDVRRKVKTVVHVLHSSRPARYLTTVRNVRRKSA